MKTGLVIGSAACVWSDLVLASNLGHFDHVAAVNTMGTDWAHELDFWVTLHPEKMVGWQTTREQRGYPKAKCVVANERVLKRKDIPYPHIDKTADYRFFSHQKGSGSSGLFATKVLLDEGCERVVLAGVPLLASQKHYNDSDPWFEVSEFTPAWQQVKPIIEGRVKSLSGWTRQLLGGPSSVWLSGA